MEIGSLVFARRLNEAFTIYTDCGNIEISIKEISKHSNQVRLCIKAPKNLRIMRDDAVDVRPSHMLFTPTVPKTEKK
jgi:carbon storage regulator CsrA